MADPVDDQKPYFDGFDAESKGLMTAKGWDKLEAPAALDQALKSYREVEKKLGIPADRVLRWPDENDADGMKALRVRLGMPETPEGYDFSTVKHADGTPAKEDFVSFMRGNAAQYGLTKDAAAGIAAAFVKFGEDAKSTDVSSTAASFSVAQQALDSLWGANKDLNVIMVDRAAAALGLTSDAVKAMVGADGKNLVPVMDGFRKIAVAMGEAKLIGGGSGAGDGNRGLTREEAAHKKEQLMNDPTFFTRWHKGDQTAVNELGNLDRIIVGGRMAA